MSVCLSLSLVCVIKLLLTFDLDAIKPQPCPREEKADSDDEDKKDDGGRVEMCADLCLLPLKRGQSHVELRLASSGVSVERRAAPAAWRCRLSPRDAVHQGAGRALPTCLCAVPFYLTAAAVHGCSPSD